MANKQSLLNVLFCDDDSQFAANQVESLLRKLKTRYGIEPSHVSITVLTNLKTVKDFAVNTEKLKEFDVIFCDLGWSDLTLEGIQILHDIQMAHPSIYAVLYTAQDEDSIIGQALQWKLDFVDQIIKVDGENYFEKMLQTIRKRFHKKRMDVAWTNNTNKIKEILTKFFNICEQQNSAFEQMKKLCDEKITDSFCFKDIFPECTQLAFLGEKFSSDQFQTKKKFIEKILDELTTSQIENDIEIFGMRHFTEEKDRTEFLIRVRSKIEKIKEELLNLVQIDSTGKTALDLLISQAGIKINVKPDAKNQNLQRYLSLIEKIKRFPRIEPPDLLALDKALYINFVKGKYGGFPQMAKERNLDLNNIYRVNRRFKRSPFVVFQYDTVKEIIGSYDPKQSESCIKNLLASEKLIAETLQNNLSEDEK